jgi:hypothetical protein
MAAIENSSRLLRPAEDALAELWQALWRVDTIRYLDLTNLSMSMEAGELLLEGHLASDTSRGRIRAIARDVPGVQVVHDHLVLDRDLAVEVAQALGGDERTSPFVLPVGCDHGWIRVGGAVPDRQVQLAAEAVAAQVPHGRGVVALPRVTGEPPTPLRRALQPRPGARVWGEDGEVGRVAQVVINPHNRLVTDVVIASSEVQESRRLRGEYVVPIQAIEIANAESVFLTHPHHSLAGFSAFDASAYLQAPATWSPPYPYRTETVRWRQEVPRPAGEAPTPRGEPPSSVRNAHSHTPPAPAIEGGPESIRYGIREGGAS